MDALSLSYFQVWPLFRRRSDEEMKKTIQDVDVAGKKVLGRVDYNVPQDRWGW